jgi:uridine phosphorylase
MRIPFAIEDLHERLLNFNENSIKITNFEMETSALYGLGKIMGHNCLTICTILANRATNGRSTNYKKSIDNLIDKAIEKLV